MKTGMIVILVIAIVVAGYFGLRGLGVFGAKEAPEVWEQPVNAIYVDTLEPVEVTTGDWHNNFATDKDTGYKITDDGRKIALPMRCPNCRASIPPAPVAENADPDEEFAAKRDYNCPECGEAAYPEHRLEQ